MALDVEASIGIVLSPWHGTDTEELLRNADIAMYAAKERKAGAVVFEPEEHVTAPWRLTVLGDLRRALEGTDELFLNFQPKYTLDGERIEGVEALLRWQHPAEGLIPPDEFIPVAEHTGLIRSLTMLVLEQATAQCAAWRARGWTLRMSVNLSARGLLHGSLVDDVRDLLERQALAPEALCLELTESSIMADPRRGVEVLERLRAIGLAIAVDDFGTGHSSLQYLKRLPIAEIKIDKSFVLGMDRDVRDVAIVRSVVELAANLGFEVVAEGVENDDAEQTLRGLGCSLVQGYHYSRPLPGDAVTAWLAARLDEASVAPVASAV
jgi:EAL domain-containing protein (putative c-di-GMP-specific phosphodiesterase class I)